MFKALKSRNFKLFFYGQSVSLIGTWMQKTAVSWIVYRLTGSAILLGVVTFASLIPSLILSPLAGSLLERYNRYRALVLLQSLSMLQAGLLALLFYFQMYNMAVITGLSLFQGVINAFDVTCRQSMMADLVDHRDHLPNAIALNSTMTNFARIAGPALAGILLSTFGEDFCFISNFISYFPVLICLGMINIPVHSASQEQKSILRELHEGFTYVSSKASLARMVLMLAVSSLLVIPFNTLMPVYAKDIFHGTAKTFSWFESAAGLGSILSAVYLASLKPGKDMIRLMLTATCLLGLSVIVLSFTQYLGAALICMVISGVGMMAQTSSINIFIQTHSRPEMRSRVISYYVMAYQGMVPVGSLLAGTAVKIFGVRATVAGMGITALLSVLIFLFFLYRRELAQLLASRRRILMPDTGGN